MTAGPPLGLGGSALLFGGGGLLLLAVTRVAVPALASAAGVEPGVAWLSLSSLFFSALLAVGWWMLHAERACSRRAPWRARLRLAPMSGGDRLAALAAFVLIAAASGALVAGLRAVAPAAELQPAFLEMAPLGPGRWWILALWLPSFAITVLSEEIVWRGVVLPRQEAAFGRRAWLANGAGWLLFHLAFGWAVLITLLPIVLVLPWAVQRRRCTRLGVAVHAALNAIGFLTVALGLV